MTLAERPSLGTRRDVGESRSVRVLGHRTVKLSKAASQFECASKYRAGRACGRRPLRAFFCARRFAGLAALIFCLAGHPAAAQTTNDSVDLTDLLPQAQQWAWQNLDTNVLAVVSQIDPEAVLKFYRDLQAGFRGNQVVDLASLRQTARTLLPLLASREETRPYAAWLKAQMDYLDMADQIRRAAPPLRPATNQPPRAIVNPPAQKERELWARKVSGRPWPAAARAYVAELKPIFAAKNVPPELVWVAEVESSFDREAESPAGAGGLFQLMPETARRFGLSLWPQDQRFQPVPSATASAEYFRFLYDRFHDWRLVMAAYNAGEGTIQRLLSGRKTRSYDAISVRLPAETQMYVPRVEAVIWEREGARLEQLAPPQT